MAREKKKEKFTDYKEVDMEDIVTFGTSVYLRKDGQGLKVVFPAGQIMTFEPNDNS